MRRKTDKTHMESLAEEAAFVIQVKDEVLAVMPVDPELLAEKWIMLYANGDPSVILEVQSAIMNRDCSNVRDVQTIAGIMNTHAGNTPLPNVAVHELSKLEEETFALKMKQLEYDIQACRVAKAKKSTWEFQVHHTKLQFRVKIYEEALKSARMFINDHCKIVTYNTCDEMLRSLQSFMAEKTHRLKLDERGNVSW